MGARRLRGVRHVPSGKGEVQSLFVPFISYCLQIFLFAPIFCISFKAVRHTGGARVAHNGYYELFLREFCIPSRQSNFSCCGSAVGSFSRQQSMIRRVLPKKTKFDGLQQKNVDKLAQWMNRYSRQLFKGRSTRQMARAEKFHFIKLAA